jgi:hypothetical protein
MIHRFFFLYMCLKRFNFFCSVVLQIFYWTGELQKISEAINKKVNKLLKFVYLCFLLHTYVIASIHLNFLTKATIPAIECTLVIPVSVIPNLLVPAPRVPTPVIPVFIIFNSCACRRLLSVMPAGGPCQGLLSVMPTGGPLSGSCQGAFSFS